MNKKLLTISAIILAISVVILSMTDALSGSYAVNNVTPTPQKIYIDQINYTNKLGGYNIDKLNYFKLRDLAKLLSRHERFVAIDYDPATDSAYINNGSEYVETDGKDNANTVKEPTPVVSKTSIYIDGVEKNIKGYLIEGSNYYMLRDVLKELNIGVIYDRFKDSVYIDTSLTYAQGLSAQRSGKYGFPAKDPNLHSLDSVFPQKRDLKKEGQTSPQNSKSLDSIFPEDRENLLRYESTDYTPQKTTPTNPFVPKKEISMTKQEKEALQRGYQKYEINSMTIYGKYKNDPETFINILNDYRRENGLPPVDIDLGTIEVAKERCLEEAYQMMTEGKMDHKKIDSSSPLVGNLVNENLNWYGFSLNHPRPKSSEVDDFNNWKNSPTHNQNLLFNPKEKGYPNSSLGAGYATFEYLADLEDKFPLQTTSAMLFNVK